MTIHPDALNVLMGWSQGYTYANCKAKEDEIAQGENYYLSAFPLMGQINILCDVIYRVAHAVLAGAALTTTRILTTVVPLAGIPFCLLCAAVKHDNYKNFAQFYNNFEMKKDAVTGFFGSIPGTLIYYTLAGVGYCMPGKIPDSLGDVATQFYSFFPDHLGDIIRVAILAGAVALIALEQYCFGIALLAGVGFQVIDSMGWLPRKVSLFAETYLPVVTSLVLATTGSWLLTLQAVPLLLTSISPTINQYIHHKVDSFYRYLRGVKGPTLQEFEAPLVERKDLSFDEIKEILNDDWTNEYEVNPAHCSKSVFSDSDLGSEEDFDKFRPLFKETEWKTKAGLLDRKFIDDERCIASFYQEYKSLSEEEKAQFDSSKFPVLHADKRKNLFKAERPKDLKEKLDKRFSLSSEDSVQLLKDLQAFDDERKAACLQMMHLMAEKKGILYNEFLATLLEEKMELFLKILKGEIRPQGTQKDLDDGINNSKKILHYLLTEKLSDVEREDILLKLFIEGGDYCSRGIKRASHELLSNIIYDRVSKLKDQYVKGEDSTMEFEVSLKGCLQDMRYREIQTIFDEIKTKLSIPGAIGNDVHAFDIYREALSLGFSPLTDHERADVNIGHLINWEQFSHIRDNMLANYFRKLNKVDSEIGRLKFACYIRQVINSNSKLSEEEKEAIIAIFTARRTDKNHLKWTEDETAERFAGLVYVMLGIIRKKAAA